LASTLTSSLHVHENVWLVNFFPWFLFLFNNNVFHPSISSNLWMSFLIEIFLFFYFAIKPLWLARQTKVLKLWRFPQYKGINSKHRPNIGPPI
jgi:hypothetical protein